MRSAYPTSLLALAPMLLALAPLLLAAESAALSKQARTIIPGEDDRVVVEVRGYPWGAIGRVNSTLGPFCTGTLVGPRQVLTAAHCLWNQRTASWLPPCALHFLLGYQRSEYLAHSLVVSYRLQGQHAPEDMTGPPEITSDWALLTLAKDLGTITTTINTAPLDPELLDEYRREHGEFVQAGYSRDRAHILTRHDNCALVGFASKGRLVLHRCDATSGDSGSPILLHQDGNYQIVALHLATADAAGQGVALAGSVFHDKLQHLEAAPPTETPFKACQTQPKWEPTIGTKLSRAFTDQ